MSARTDLFFVGDGLQVTLGDMIGEGKQGLIHDVVGEPALAAKVFLRSRPMPRRVESHLRTDARTWFDDEGNPRLGWPIARLIGDNGVPRGYLMVRFADDWRPLDDLLSGADRMTIPIEWTWRDLIHLAGDLAELVHLVHRNGFVVGDLSATNVLASPDGRVALVDCDDMVAIGAPPDTAVPPLTTPRYGAPERHRPPPSAYPSRETDAWALGIIIIQLLQDGAHPFEGPTRTHFSPRGVLQNVEDGHTRFTPRSRVHRTRPAVHPSWLPVETLPPTLLDLARACVVDGRRDPGARPRAHEWAAALRKVTFSRCADQPGHVFSDHLPACPWCAHVLAGQGDPFPAVSGTRR